MRHMPIKRSAWLIVICSLAIAVLLAGCTQGEVVGGKGGEAKQDAAVAFEWAADADCSMCHAAEASSMKDAGMLAATHETAGAMCSTCHSDSKGLAQVHVDATPELAQTRATKLRSTQIDRQACMSCHGGEDELSEMVAGSDVLTDSRGLIVNPHELPENEEHAESDCSSCHSMHDGESASEAASEYCSGCHHAGVYECHTCHE